MGVIVTPFANPFDEGHMRRVNNFPFYELGAAMQPLLDINTSTKTRVVAWPIIRAQWAIRAFLDERFIPITYCVQTARELFTALRNVIAADEPIPTISEDQEIGVNGYLISDKAKTFEHELAAELRQLDTYFISQKGIFSTAKLMNQTDEFFQPSIRAHFTERITFDIREAGKCIACELGTAAGFHIARAVESVLLLYLEKLCPQVLEKLTDSQRNLGYYIKLAVDNNGRAEICGCLDQFRDLHRNPLMHPEAILSNDQAMSLLGMAQSSITAMTMEIATYTPQLPMVASDGQAV